METRIPRLPTEQEKIELRDWLASTMNGRGDAECEQDAMDTVENACIAVFDNYISNGPGYAGKIMMVVWGGGPEIHQVFCWSGDRMYPVSPDTAA